MTAARRRRKRQKQRGGPVGCLAGAVLLTLTAVAAAEGEILRGEPVVVNPASGLAISGFDPVAYFSRGEAVMGRARLELGWGGVVWRFVNDGNRAAFADHAEVYAPQFGGYDPVDVARGKPVQGMPRLWMVRGQRLYLFASVQSRRSFSAAPEAGLAKAEAKWPEVLATISP